MAKAEKSLKVFSRCVRRRLAQAQLQGCNDEVVVTKLVVHIALPIYPYVTYAAQERAADNHKVVVVVGVLKVLARPYSL